MACTNLPLPGGGFAIVCGPRGRAANCYRHKRASKFQCDWKLEHASGETPPTCDRYLCASCALEVAPEKHLCPEHQAAYALWREERGNRVTVASVHQSDTTQESEN